MKLFKENTAAQKLLIALVASLLIAGAVLIMIGFFLIVTQAIKPVSVSKGVACTDEAKVCPDGTAVGRTGPDCQFAACPAATAGETTAWKTLVDETAGVSLKFPSDIGTKYIFAQTWPPQVTVADNAQYCTQPVRLINNKAYCVSESEDGAAGTVYSSYRYSLADPASNKTVTLEFVLGSPQCGNFDEPKMTECANERAAFEVDALVDKIMNSIAPIAKPETNATAPANYSPSRYTVAQTSETACAADTDCVTPMQYEAMSSCPYSSRCLNNKCAVVCPQPNPVQYVPVKNDQ
jgi:hypothetical protein